MANEPTWNLWHGDCRDMLRELPENSIDSVVTDPPYELGFMGRDWDRTGIANDVEMWKLALRVLKPGGHLLAFSGTRTYHRMVCAIEDAGFEIRDQLAWVYGQGMPKGQNLGKDAGSSLSGWYTALKPAQEPIVLARKSLSEATVKLNAERWGVGALNIDATRIELIGKTDPRLGGRGTWQTGAMAKSCYGEFAGAEVGSSALGRFPANLLHDGSPEVLAAFPDAPGQQGDLIGHDKDRQSPNGCYGKMSAAVDAIKRDEVDKSAARFFYCAKATKHDRAGSKHPTVKPIALMRYLCRLVTPPGGTVLDPFGGSGTTAEAAIREGLNIFLSEKEDQHVADIEQRMATMAERE